MLHIDKALTQNSPSSNKYFEATNAQKVLHPTQSPDSASKDIIPFGCHKEKLRAFTLIDE
jgi:hypothetical protein